MAKHIRVEATSTVEPVAIGVSSAGHVAEHDLHLRKEYVRAVGHSACEFPGTSKNLAYNTIGSPQAAA